MSEPELIDLQDVAPAEVAELDLYQKREKIYTRQIEGFYQRIRLLTGWPLLLGYFLLPWLNIDGRQAVWFDLPARKFYVLTLTFWPQDFPLLAFLLMIAAFGLFAVTVVAGRIWCGYTCPQTVWTAIFMWLEQKAEGTRNQRIKLDQAPWSLEKVLRKLTKHGSWLVVAALTGATFIGYFYPIRTLTAELFTFSSGWLVLSWVIFFTLATYINAGWMREQVCTYMCPYARFQSVMFDKDTLIVSYDTARGEPRGSRKRTVDPGSVGLGDCINCELCVQVCPTGIDIRDGLQYECIGCALCVDACDSVMKKMDYDPGLIRYTSENALAGSPRHWLRPRVLGYVTMIALMLAVFAYNIISRNPVEMTAIRDRNTLFFTTEEGNIANVYRIHILNKDNMAHTFKLSVDGVSGAKIVGDKEYSVEGGGDLDATLRVVAPPQNLDSPTLQIRFRIEAIDMPSLRAGVDSRFLHDTASR